MQKLILRLVGILCILGAAGVISLCLRPSRGLAEDKKEQPPQTTICSYDIRDLLWPIPSHPLPTDDAAPSPQSQADVSQGTGGPFGGSVQNQQHDEDKADDIIKQIEEYVVPNSWRDTGGTMGAIQMVRNWLIITQTPDNQRAVQQVLDGLRRQKFGFTIEIDADWLLLTNDQLSAWQAAAKTSAEKGAENSTKSPAPDAAAKTLQPQAALDELLKAYLNDPHTVFARGRVLGMNGQTVSIYGGRSTKIINGAAPVISTNTSSIQAQIERIHSGAALEVLPLLIQSQPEMQFSNQAATSPSSPSAPEITNPPAAPTTLILDLRSSVREDLPDHYAASPATLPTTQPAAAVAEDSGNAAATVALAAQALNEPDHQEQQFQATVRLRIGVPMMIDGLTHFPGKSDSRQLCLIVTAHIMVP